MATRLARGVVRVVPMTSNVVKIYPFQIVLPAATTGLAIDSKAHTELIRSVPTERLRHRIGRISHTERAALNQALRLHLDL
jgi:mRNA interferase MazF